VLQLDIKCEDFELTGEVTEYIRQRAGRLDQFFDPITQTRVIVEAPVSHHRQGGPFTVRIEVDVPGELVTVSHQKAEELHVAIRQSFEAAERQLQDYARKRRGQVKTPVQPPVGRVARVFPREGYGFLVSPEGHEVYFHEHSVLGGKFGELQAGTEVRFAEEEGDEGPQASTVEIA
jgi:ribosomal subunit interface protein